MERKTRTSKIWTFFRPIDDTFAICNICKAKRSYKTSTTNLSKHIQRIHPTSALPSHYKFKYLSQKRLSTRGKHRNSVQEKILVDFVKKHPLLLQNPSKGNRNTFESLWERLKSELNNHGPPEKDVSNWKKSLKDWRRLILKKLEKNKVENAPYGPEIGGRTTCLNTTEETIASLCNLNEDIDHVITYPSSDDDFHDTYKMTENSYDLEDIVDETDFDELGAIEEPEETKTEIVIDPLYLQRHKIMHNMHNSNNDDSFQSMAERIDSIHDIVMQTQTALNSFCVLYKQKLHEDRRHHLALEQIMAEKVALKKQLLAVEQQKIK